MNYLFLQKNWRKPVIIGLIFVLSGFLLWATVIRTPAYAVYVDSEKKFTIKSQDQAEKILADIKSEQQQKCQQKLELTNKVEYNRVFAHRQDLVAETKMKAELTKALNFKTMAAAVVVNGKTVAYVNTSTEAKKLLAKLKKDFGQVEEGEKLLSVAFDEKVAIKEQKDNASKVSSVDGAYEKIITGTDNPQKYIVKEGDSLWLIARRHDMYVDDIVRANNLKSENLSLDQELILVTSKPYITVVAKVEGERIETIPYETKVIVDKNSATTVRVKEAGSNGEKKVLYIATKCNGVVEKKDIKEETIIKEAVARVMIKGSKVANVASRSGGSGSLDWPCYGPVTNYFRSGHSGIDIAPRSGTPIRVADAGYVTFTGYQGGYGNFIIIDHGNGLVTRYAHCSSINVSKGQTVSAGTVIGAVGSTGRSTGPHLHFEVLSGGSFVNPLSYLR